MTTILADVKHGVMVADSSVTDDDRVWVGKKVFRVKGSLIGVAGLEAEITTFIKWFRGGMVGKVDFNKSSALILNSHGLFFYDHNYTTPQRIAIGREAVGSGAKSVMCAYEALNFQDPRRAVRIVCKHDANSRTPVRQYKL
jgi:hypothetical protein